MGAHVDPQTSPDELEEYRPRQDDGLVLTIEPSPAPRPGLVLVALFLGIAGYASFMGHPLWGLAILLPTVFLYIGFRVLWQPPVRVVLRFLEEGVELTTEGHRWMRVPWDLVTRLVKLADGGAELQTGSDDVQRQALTRLPKPQVDELLAAQVLPTHVELVEIPPPAENPSPRKTLALWVLLLAMLAVIYWLVGR